MVLTVYHNNQCDTSDQEQAGMNRYGKNKQGDTSDNEVLERFEKKNRA